MAEKGLRWGMEQGEGACYSRQAWSLELGGTDLGGPHFFGVTARQPQPGAEPVPSPPSPRPWKRLREKLPGQARTKGKG